MLMLFRQVQQHGDNFSYITADEATHEAAVIDPSFNAGEITRILNTEHLTLKYIFNTHGHSDHTAGNQELRSATGAKTVVHALSRSSADIKVADGDTINVGGIPVKVIHTPGHTPDSICLLVNGTKLLTGDTLFVGECGRTDMPGGNSRSLYDSLFHKLMKLSDDIEVYPGHDYGPKPHSTIGEERRTNYVLEPRTVDEFVAFMNQP
ncbi:MAG: MBL fold metallo-hydrolase [Candidatus Bathyarchaeia archaeon]